MPQAPAHCPPPPFSNQPNNLAPARAPPPLRGSQPGAPPGGTSSWPPARTAPGRPPAAARAPRAARCGWTRGAGPQESGAALRARGRWQRAYAVRKGKPCLAGWGRAGGQTGRRASRWRSRPLRCRVGAAGGEPARKVATLLARARMVCATQPGRPGSPAAAAQRSHSPTHPPLLPGWQPRMRRGRAAPSRQCRSPSAQGPTHTPAAARCPAAAPRPPRSRPAAAPAGPCKCRQANKYRKLTISQQKTAGGHWQQTATPPASPRPPSPHRARVSTRQAVMSTPSGSRPLTLHAAT